MRKFLFPALSCLMVAGLQAPAYAGFCSDLRYVVRIAASDRLASIGTGDFYTGPESAGHSGVEFPLDDTQRTTASIAGAKFCGVDTLPRIGTHRYSCEFNAEESSIVSEVGACYPQVAAERDSGGEGTNWNVKFGDKEAASINVWATEADIVRITIAFSGGEDDDDPFSN